MDLEESLERLPDYLHEEDEENRIYLQITKDIQGNWLMCYETEGRCYYPTTNESLIECAGELYNQVKAL